MRTAEVDYDFVLSQTANWYGHAPKVMITISWEIEFEAQGKGTEDQGCLIKPTPISIQAMIGGMPFAQVEWKDVSKQYPFRAWVEERGKELTFEAIGYTEQEAFREACEEDDESAYWSSQIGRPL